MRIILRSLVYALVVLLAGAVALLIGDLAKLHNQPAVYGEVYGFTGAEAEWSHRSVINYVVRSILLVGFFLVGIILAIRRLGSTHRSSMGFAMYLVLLLGLALITFLAWWHGGFGH